ncbi:hypothetical protein CLU79DRAFT_714491 [Phycomyces nitens]|nr:hypothetical protein CLU79DRAFT_714491 [Phycomyces nitens]
MNHSMVCLVNSTEVIMFQFPAPKPEEYLRYHSWRSRLVMMRSVGSDIRLSALMSTVWNPSYSKEVIMFQWPAPKRQEFLRYHSWQSRLVMMRSVGSDIRLSVSCQLSGILVDYMDPDSTVLVSVTVEYDGLPVTLWPVNRSIVYLGYSDDHIPVALS